MVSIFLASASFAQNTAWNRNKASGPGNLYDRKTIERVKGEVLRVEEFTLAQGMPPGMELFLRAEDREVVRVLLGPRWYLESADFEIEPKDILDVKGSKVTYEGRPTIVAAVIFRGEEVLKLRDENGVPVWSAWAPRQ